MSFRFIVGRAGSGKTETCLQEIREKLLSNSKGSPIIYLVPDQMTFQSEYELINTQGISGMIRAQVFSFTRLAWRVLQETGGLSRYHLNTVGVNMLLRKIIEHRKQELKVFAKASEKSGFIKQIEEMITECKRYRVEPDELIQKKAELSSANEQPSQQVLADKLHDLQLIYEDLEKLLFEKYVDSEDYLRLLSEKVADSSYLQAAEVYVDGFHSYTPQEIEVLVQLMKTCKRVTVVLTADKPYDEYPPNDLHLFHMTGNTYQKLRSLALEQSVEIEPVLQLHERPRYENEPSLAHLETEYDTRPTVSYEGKAAVSICQALNRRAEVEGVAREIQKLVRDEVYRYREIAILIRNSNDYHHYVETIFDDYQIPYFIDQKRSMLNHPLIEFIRSSLEVVTGNWRYEAVFRCVKTDLLFPVGSRINDMREEMDQLENYVLAYGIQGSKWTSKERWTYRRIHALEGTDVPKTDEERNFEERINKLRQLIVGSLKSFQNRIKKAKSGRDKCEALYLFLDENEIPKKIEFLRNQAESEGKLSVAREHDQVWKAVVELLDQFVETLGEEEVSMKLFTNILETGMDSMRFALVPPAIDQVLVASLERSRFSNIKCTFIVGANEGVIPAKPNEEGVLSEGDRERLTEVGLKLAPGGRQQLLDENFIIYTALTSSSEKLYVSYPLANEEGKALLPSVLLKRLKDLFPTITEKLFVNDPGELHEKEQLEYVVNPNVTLSYLASQLQAWKRHYPFHELWWDVYNYYTEQATWRQKGRKVLGSLFYRNETKSLPQEISQNLYGDTIQASVSRMEMFKGCHFSHFAAHGLKLKERQIFRLEAPDIGQLFHSALKMISERLRENNMDWKDLTQKLSDQFSAEVVEQLAPRLQKEILLSSNRHHYIKRKLQQIISRASTVLSEHAKASGFTPVGLELGFGKNEPLPPISFQLDNGTTMELIGRIDRVDKAESSKGVLLRIVDYKSSQKALHLSEVYYGLALQMLTYLDVVISHSKAWVGTSAKPAGVLYFHVHNPIINSNTSLSEDKLEEEIFKKFKMNGLLLGDEEAVRLMDQTIDTGHSQVVSAGLKKNGGFHSYSSIASEEEFDYLRNHVRNVFKEIGTDISNGAIDITPYKLKNKTPCTFCSYKTVCQFDQSLEENNYRLLHLEKRDVVFDKIRKGVDEGEH